MSRSRLLYSLVSFATMFVSLRRLMLLGVSLNVGFLLVVILADVSINLLLRQQRLEQQSFQPHIVELRYVSPGLKELCRYRIAGEALRGDEGPARVASLGQREGSPKQPWETTAPESGRTPEVGFQSTGRVFRRSLRSRRHPGWECELQLGRQCLMVPQGRHLWETYMQ